MSAKGRGGLERKSSRRDGLGRRQFLKLVGVGAGGVVAASCQDAPPRTLYPYVVPPRNALVGEAAYYTSVCRECPAGCGLLARVREGRPVKLEGHPEHPVNRGSLCARGQAGLLRTYGPERLRVPLDRRGSGRAQTSWRSALIGVGQALARARAEGEGRVLVWSGPETGTLRELLERFAQALGGTLLTTDPHQLEPQLEAHRLAFGQYDLPRPRLGESDLVVALEADLFETYLSPVELARQVVGPDHLGEHRARLVWAGPRRGVTGMLADHWVPARPGAAGPFSLALVSHLVAAGGPVARAAERYPELLTLLRAHPAESLARRAGVEMADLRELAERLATARRPVVLPPGALGTGPDGAAGHLAVVVLNALLGAYDSSLVFGASHALSMLTPAQDLRSAVTRMRAGEVRVLLVANQNPLFDLPGGLDLAGALERVDLVVALSDLPHATTDAADVVLPASSPLESWGDYAPRQGVEGLMQPVLEPLHATRTTGDILLGLAQQAGVIGEVSPEARTFEEALRERWARLSGLSDVEADGAFREHQRLGGQFDEPALREAGELQPATFERLGQWLGDSPAAVPELALTSYAPIGAGLSELATGGWLDELPEPTTAAVWGSPAEIHPDLARRLALPEADPREAPSIVIQLGDATVRLPVAVLDSVRPDVVAVPVGGWPSRDRLEAFAVAGYRSKDLRLAIERGDQRPATAAARLLPATALTDGAGVIRAGQAVTVNRGDPLRLFVETRHFSQHSRGHNRGIVRARGIDLHLQEHPELPRALTDMHGEREYPTYRWGMAIDLDRCTGCSACIMACQAENNVSVVGPEHVDYGREMAWLQLHVYWERDHADRAIPLCLPMLCQHCHQAPCESVCPVYAPYQTPEGLNAQIYNRCVGTRFCSNNCPYKVRRFNWLGWRRPEPLPLQLNPDVTTRSEGVMEKCTFCMQRIRVAKEEAKLAGRERLRDGEVVPACAQTCPTGALVFGDIRDPETRVSRLIRTQQERAYHVLERVGTRPAITYLERVVRWRS